MTGKATSLQNTELAACRELESTAVPTAREGDMKKQREWGKDCFLQTWYDLSLKKIWLPLLVPGCTCRVVSAFLSLVPLFHYSRILLL